MNLSIGKKIGVGFALALAALVAIGVTTAINLSELDQGTFWVAHTIEVKRRLAAVFAAVLEAESSARGYQLLPSADVKQLAATSRQTAEDNLAALKQLTADNPNQIQNLAKLTALIRSRLDDSQALITSRDTQSGNGALDNRQRALVQSGRSAMDALRSQINDMVAEEDRLLVTRQKEEAATSRTTWNTIIYGTLGAFLLVTLAGIILTRNITHAIRVVGEGAERIGSGDYAHRVAVLSKDEVSRLADLFNRMAAQIAERQASLAEQDWFKGGLARFSAIFEGQREVAAVGRTLLAELAPMLDVRHSVLYVPRETDDGTRLRLQASYAADHAPIEIAPGEGLIGQAYSDGRRQVLEQVPTGYLRIRSALGETPPTCVVVLPARFEGRVRAVLELAAWRRFSRIELDLLDRLADSLGVVLNVIEAGQRTEDLLRKSQALTESLRSSEMELQEQQEELKQANEELEQTNEEMQQTNEEMEEKVHLLAEQKQELERANREIQLTREALEERARQVEQASKYKTDFLASMSHELRTPLNSMLILSKLLADNPEGGLTAKQVQYAQTIHGSGNSLLELINDILDLSKIEAGSVQADIGPVALGTVRQAIQDEFGPVAESKGLHFAVECDPRLPASFATDERRLLQIIKNLLGNAFKFTAKGGVTLRVKPVESGWDPGAVTLNRAAGVLAFAVEDTGIGIPADKHRMIFEAFQQGEAGTARKYGGTGLGLSISRELAILLGGSIAVSSTPGAGSVFTLYLPTSAPSPAARPAPSLSHRTDFAAPALAGRTGGSAEAPIEPDADAVPDDRAAIGPGDMVLLIVEDDPAFARILMDFAREKQFKVLAARTAESALRLARRYKPSAVTLDLKLPDSDGRVVLDRLKHDPATRHIPIHIISVEAEGERILRQGAVSSLRKPVTKEAIDAALGSTLEFLRRPLKNLLIVEDDPGQRDALAALIGGGDVQITAAASAAEAFTALEGRRFDCVVVDLGLPDRAGLELIREVHRRLAPNPPPIIVYTGKDLTREEETQLRLLSNSIVLKSARSPERLLEETGLFLHRVQARLPTPAREMIERSMKNDSVLAGRKVLVVDDDVRNIFAISSALESAQVEVRYAESGQAGIDLLQREPDIEAVLMDVMMPEMDGFEATRRIRGIDRFRKIPIIAVTAKAMKGDREKCLEAGASDYITKPVDMDQLRSLLRVWLYR